MGANIIVKKAQVAWQRFFSAITERRLRISTTGRVEPLTSDGVHYTPLPYVMIHRMLDKLSLDSEDVFVDIGCGKGRVLCCVSRVLLKRVVGVEQNSELLRIAKENLNSLRGRRTPVELIHCSAELYPFDDATVIYLYNPFGEAITTRVMDAIGRAWHRCPRRIRIIYANPVYERIFDRFEWLQKAEEWHPNDFPGFGYPVSFWETREACPSISEVKTTEKSKSLPAIPGNGCSATVRLLFSR